MDTVCIEDLRVDTVVGAYAWERQLRQPLLIRGVRERDHAPPRQICSAAAGDV